MPAPQISYQPLSMSDEQAKAILNQEYELAASRRSVRGFSDRAVSRQTIEALISIAATAPSGANLQPWHFVAIDDPALKREIRVAAEKEEKDFYERRAPAQWLNALAPLGTDWRKPFLEVAPWLVVVFRQRWLQMGTQRQKTYYSAESVGIAVGMLIAAIHRAGLVTLTHTPAPMNFLRDICKRPDNESPYVLMPIGHPATECTVPDIQRKPLSEILQFNVT